MKKLVVYTIIGFTLIFGCFLLLKSCIIHNPNPEDCVIATVKITRITEGSSYDIVFYDEGQIVSS